MVDRISLVRIVAWVMQRARDDSGNALPAIHRRLLLSRLFVAFDPISKGPRAARVVDGRVVFELIAGPRQPQLKLIVVDEAHHLYADDHLRTAVDQLVAPPPGADASQGTVPQLLLLSDLSQSQGTKIAYPTGLVEVALEEVVRSSERVILGAATFQLGGSAKSEIRCHHGSLGPPLKTILFDSVEDVGVHKLYAHHVTRALVRASVVNLAL